MTQLDPNQIEEIIRLLRESGTLPLEWREKLFPDDEKLERSERRYRSLFDGMSSGVAVYEAVEDGADFVFKDFNLAGCKIDQIEKDGIIGCRVTDCFPAVERFGLLEVFRRVWRTGKSEHHPISLYRDDRITGWRENFVYRLPSGEVVAVYDDTTKQKQAEAALRESERKFRNLSEEISEGVAVAIDGKNHWVNQAFADIVGYDREELIGQGPGFLAVPEDLPALLEIIRRRAAGDEAPTDYETRLKRKDGTVIFAEVSAKLIEFEKRQATQLVVRDITQLKATLRAFGEAEQKYRSLVQSLSAGVVVHIEGNVVFCNPAMAELLGMDSPEQLIGTTIDDWSEPDSMGLTNSDRSRLELSLRRRDGKLFDVEAWSAPVTWEGRPAAQLVVVDISARKRAEEKRRNLEAEILSAQKNESLGLLAGGIAHDFNNLLMGVLGHADLAMLEISPSSSVGESIEQIEKTARQAAELCKQLLTYSGKGRLQTGPLNLRTLIEDMAQLLRMSISKRATIEYDFSDQLPTIAADASQLRQVVMNLIINASESLLVSGVVSVSVGVTDCTRSDFLDALVNCARSDGPYVFLSVTDTGCGMDEQTQHRVFDPFFSTKLKGRGLGLAAVLGVVQSHNGAIKVKSEPGLGSTFTVFFPASGEPAQLSDETALDEECPGTGTILVIDDETTAREVTGRFLETAGFSVLLARDGNEGLGVLKANADVVAVVLDLTMPGMDGSETFTKLRQIRSDVPVVFVSGYDERSVSDSLPLNQGTSFLQKPYRRKELIATLRELLTT